MEIPVEILAFFDFFKDFWMLLPLMVRKALFAAITLPAMTTLVFKVWGFEGGVK